jgi:carbon-monoxide dehydrogenase large subunit
VRHAAGTVRERIVEVAEHLLEARGADLELHQGSVRVAGSPERAVTLAQVAQAVSPGSTLPPGVEEYELQATDIFHPPDNAFPYGTHIASVEVDVHTGVVTPRTLTIVTDSGTLINPLIVDGQYHGGAALGIGGALYEEVLYDEDGNPRNPSFMDYLVPTVDVMPEVRLGHMATPSPHNPDGMKGAGEGGAIGPPAAIANAVSDALAPFGVVATETPVTPERVRALLREVGA